MSRAADPAGAAPAGARAPARPLKILVVGEEHIRTKVARHYEALESRGARVHYFIDDRSGITGPTEAEFALRVRRTADPSSGPLAVLRYMRDFVKYFNEVRPELVDVYTSINPVLVLPMVRYARMRGARVVVIGRGDLHPPDFEARSRLGQRLLLGIYRAADLVVYKETYMPAIMDRFCPGTPRFAWSNAIPVRPEPRYARDENYVLFLNFFKKWRNVHVIVEAAPRIREAFPDVQIHLVGGTADLSGASAFYAGLNDYERGIHQRIAELGLEGTVFVHPYTPQVAGYFARAKAYLLPADLVYCNYALLEAMERGVPPVVSADVDVDARLIVDDGENGLVAHATPEGIAGAVIRLLGDEEARQEMGRAARATVEARFNLDRTMDALLDEYEALVARGRRRG